MKNKVTRRTACVGLVAVPVAIAFGLHQSALAGATIKTIAVTVPPKDMIGRVIYAVASDGGLSADVILSPLRTAQAVAVRQKGFYLAFRMSGKSLPEIGRRFGGRDHTTVLHAIRKIEARADSDPLFGAELMRLAQQIDLDAETLIAQSRARSKPNGSSVS